MRVRKKYWLWPIFIMMALLGALIVLAQGSAVAPFIYTLVLKGSDCAFSTSPPSITTNAAALIEDGRIVAAAQEERFSRKKHDARFPSHAIQYCLSEIGGGLGGVDRVVFYDKPFLKFERLVETYLAFAPRGFKSFRMAIPLWLREKLFLKDLLKKELGPTTEAGWNVGVAITSTI